MSKGYLICLVIWIIGNSAFSQDSKKDSLLLGIEKLPEDTAKVNRLFEAARQFDYVDFITAAFFYQQAYQLSKKLNYVERIPELESRIGAIKANTSLPDSALYYFNLAQAGFQNQNRDKELAGIFGKMRWVYNYLGDYKTALEYAFKSLNIFEKLEDQPGIAMAYGNIGDILMSQEKYSETIEYAEKALKIQKELNLSDDLGYTYQQLADSWLQLKEYDKALGYANESLKIRQELNGLVKIGLSYNTRANIQKLMGSYEGALNDYQKSLDIARETGFVGLERTCISNMGHVYSLMGNYKEALPNHLKTRQYVVESNEQYKGVENLKLLAEAYGGIGKYDSAYVYHQQFAALRDSLLSEEKNAQMSELQTQYETAQKEAKIAIQEGQINQKQTQLWGALGLLGLALFAGFWLWQLTKKLRKRNEEKEFLIKEIHHRVKNNLQVLSSLLYLQSRHINDETALDAVREGQNRVDAMSLIHQKLYTGDNLSAVEMPQYLYDLGDTLLDSFGLEEEQVQLIYHVDPLRLDVDTAIPLGLIINELVTNSLKYGFPNNNKGKIEITLQKTKKNQLLLEVTDNGIGKGATIESKNSTGFGTNLIQILSKKLKGKPEISTENGYTTRIVFDQFEEINS